jgi:N-acetylmuramoyl-L-alanine amidase
LKTLRNKIVLLVVLVLLGSTTLCIGAVKLDYQKIRESYISLVGSAQAQRQRHNWLKVISKLEAFVTSSADGSRKDDAMFLLGRSWHGLSLASGRRDDARKAIGAYENLANRFPDSNFSDDALIFAAEISSEIFSNQTDAYKYYLQITTVLSPGDMLEEAQSRLKHLATVAPKLPVVAKTTTTQTVGSGSALSAVRVWSSPEYTRIVLDLNRSVQYESHQLKGKDPRIYVDLKGTKISREISGKQQVKDGIVSRIRSSQLDPSRVRVVLDLTRDGDYQVFALENPARVVIDVRKPGSGPQQTEIRSLSASGNDSIAGILDDVSGKSPPVLHVPQHNKNEGINLIVVDAGHGGRDPGAVGRNKTREKDVTLQMAKKLATALRKELGCKVLLTRSDDRYLTLHSRTAYANKVGADLFISLHANASTNRNAYGLETYYLNLSKNNQAAAVAARENGISLEEVGNLEAILFDLMANAKINESSRLAAEIQQAMIKYLSPKFSRIKDLGVRQGPFHVLLGATMPSVLVETAFLSNAREEKRLNSSDYQKRVAQAIVRGVKDYSATIKQVARR